MTGIDLVSPERCCSRLSTKIKNNLAGNCQKCCEGRTVPARSNDGDSLPIADQLNKTDTNGRPSRCLRFRFLEAVSFITPLK
nr:unnamed protein product [Haemonchus contortus]